jgi:hypothetical protein
MEKVGVQGQDLWVPRWVRIAPRIPQSSRFPEKHFVANYGNGGPADYFATAFSLTVLKDELVPPVPQAFIEGLIRNGF